METNRRQISNESADVQRVTWVGAGINLVLSVLKIVIGIMGHSAALLADGIHSLSDLASDSLVLVVTRHGAQPADDGHPYGHARFETAATVVLGVMLLVVAAGIAWDAAERSMITGDLPTPGIPVIVVAALSLASKEWLYQYTIGVARRARSRLLEANAWHHRSDAVSSLVVLIGITGAMAGFPVLDAVAAFIVALMIAHIAWLLISRSVKELVDTAVDEATQREIIELVTKTDGVVSLHLLRTRLMGASILVDAHIQVSPRLSVSEGHQIAETVECLLKTRIAHIQDVTIHVDVENDEKVPFNNHLPLRSQLLRQLEPEWSSIPAAAHIKEINLHYLDGEVEVGVLLPLPKGGVAEARETQSAFTKIAQNNPLLSAIKVNYA